MSALVAGWARAHSGRGAVSPVHALGITQRGATVLPHVALGALANLFAIAPALVRTLFVAFRVGTCGFGNRHHLNNKPIDQFTKSKLKKIKTKKSNEYE